MRIEQAEGGEMRARGGRMGNRGSGVGEKLCVEDGSETEFLTLEGEVYHLIIRSPLNPDIFH